MTGLLLVDLAVALVRLGVGVGGGGLVVLLVDARGPRAAGVGLRVVEVDAALLAHAALQELAALHDDAQLEALTRSPTTQMAFHGSGSFSSSVSSRYLLAAAVLDAADAAMRGLREKSSLLYSSSQSSIGDALDSPSDVTYMFGGFFAGGGGEGDDLAGGGGGGPETLAACSTFSIVGVSAGVGIGVASGDESSASASLSASLLAVRRLAVCWLVGRLVGRHLDRLGLHALVLGLEPLGLAALLLAGGLLGLELLVVLAALLLGDLAVEVALLPQAVALGDAGLAGLLLVGPLARLLDGLEVGGRLAVSEVVGVADLGELLVLGALLALALDDLLDAGRVPGSMLGSSMETERSIR
ncbi:2ce08255-6bae-4927-8719-642418ab59f5 [Thermothielavioides terrestris]|uniref:2ce08255-6bae-4927-8719-642418ab59f5 n=1 Tax=Thermothielavioides terrestris TaxID=2587410 RepID=A0A446BKY2_9PEZI|nr:2ce08255-6bae-4927-8719-642418ab59f5 [Thermothielavioides terrestris]